MKIIKKVYNFFLLSIYEFLSKNIEKKITETHVDKIKLKFYTPNKITFFRAKTILIKEPETISWIKNFSSNSIFWDVGSNVGTFTCVAAKIKKCKVYSFEPSYFNLGILSKNVFINGIEDLVTILPFPLTEKIKVGNFTMSSIDQGAAISTFGENFSFDGSEINKAFIYKTVGISMDQANKILNLPLPDYVKIDVDGIEHLILNGAQDALKNTKEILIEINDEFEDQRKKSTEYLKKFGLNLHSKTHQYNNKAKKIYNQIWKKK